MKELIEKQEEIVLGLQKRLAGEIERGSPGGSITDTSRALHSAVEDLSALKGQPKERTGKATAHSG